MSGERRDQFVRHVGSRLRECGFSAGTARQAVVVVFDAAEFGEHQAGANDVLDRTERARAARFRFRDDRDAYAMAHAVWRVALGQCLAVAPEEVPLAATTTGQPRLPGSALSTSLSHSGSMIAISVCTAATVGIDIERMPAKIDLESLAPVFCTRQEIEDMTAFDGEVRHRRLMELWTRKEALLKAFGVGLRTDPASTPAPAFELLLPPPDAAHYPACATRNVGHEDGWVAAVATPAGVHDARLHVLAPTAGHPN
ncbi:4'-phosphopantetheinyl transferase superfamily protein [Bacillus sp. NP157]|nr:4'-phosphopantetheinyl transferase superfamily protein [Bacillus sp. NP157]